MLDTALFQTVVGVINRFEFYREIINFLAFKSSHTWKHTTVFSNERHIRPNKCWSVRAR